jgi:hypothetical protein
MQVFFSESDLLPLGTLYSNIVYTNIYVDNTFIR